jgi:hypothetical protein
VRQVRQGQLTPSEEKRICHHDQCASLFAASADTERADDGASDSAGDESALAGQPLFADRYRSGEPLKPTRRASFAMHRQHARLLAKASP